MMIKTYNISEKAISAIYEGTVNLSQDGQLIIRASFLLKHNQSTGEIKIEWPSLSSFVTKNLLEIDVTEKEIIRSFEKRLQTKDRKPYKTPYDHGFDCGKNGPNETNSHFSIFATQEQTTEWERGKKDGEKQKQQKL